MQPRRDMTVVTKSRAEPASLLTLPLNRLPWRFRALRGVSSCVGSGPHKCRIRYRWIAPTTSEITSNSARNRFNSRR